MRKHMTSTARMQAPSPNLIGKPICRSMDRRCRQWSIRHMLCQRIEGQTLRHRLCHRWHWNSFKNRKMQHWLRIKWIDRSRTRVRWTLSIRGPQLVYQIKLLLVKVLICHGREPRVWLREQGRSRHRRSKQFLKMEWGLSKNSMSFDVIRVSLKCFLEELKNDKCSKMMHKVATLNQLSSLE